MRKYLKITILHLFLVLGGQARRSINLAQLSSDTIVPDQLPKVYHILTDNDMVQENEMSDNSIEVFRLRREHKKQKELKNKKKSVDKKPVLKMQLQELSTMNIGSGMYNRNGQDFVEVVSDVDTQRAEKGRIEDEVKDL